MNKNIYFLAGLPRSGSTLLRRHPSFSSGLI